MVKNLPAMRETWVRSLSWEDPLQKGMAIHSSIPAWKILLTEEPHKPGPWYDKDLDTTEQITLSMIYIVIKHFRDTVNI